MKTNLTRPNILLITSDQQHWNTLGFINSEIQTPNLNRLATQGTVFSRAYCANPTCTPTRASIITGQYPSRHGAWSLGAKLPETTPTIGDHLMTQGFQTALVGKAHFQPLHGTGEFPSLESYPILQDLDFWRNFKEVFYGFGHVELARNHTDEAHIGQHYAIWLEEKGCKDWRKYFRPPTGMRKPGKWHWQIPEELHYNTWIAERSNALLEKYAETRQPFLLWSSFLDPHPPYLAPGPWDAMYDPAAITIPSITPGEHARNPPHFQLTQEEQPDFSAWRESGMSIHGFHSHLIAKDELAKNIAVYYGMISLMDKYIGKILDHLDSLGLAENTIVVFTTDHGHFFGQHGLIAKAAWHYEDLLRVPLLVRWPGRVPAARVSDALQSLVDLTPTFLSMIGLKIPRIMSGLDQSRVWLGKSEFLRGHVIVENRHEPTSLNIRTYIDERYKLTVYYNRSYGELFDLQQDPGEVNNLWDEPEAAPLKSTLLLKFIHAEMGKEPLWMPRVAGA